MMKKLSSCLLILLCFIAGPAYAVTFDNITKDYPPESYITGTEMNIFSVDQYGNVIRLYPNNYIKAEMIPPGSEFVFPDDSLRNHGFKLRVATPRGLKNGVEYVLIITTKEEGFFLIDPALQNPTISDLMTELLRLDPAAWTEKTIGYEVVK